jgi:hypothetical protein
MKSSRESVDWSWEMSAFRPFSFTYRWISFSLNLNNEANLSEAVLLQSGKYRDVMVVID